MKRDVGTFFYDPYLTSDPLEFCYMCTINSFIDNKLYSTSLPEKQTTFNRKMVSIYQQPFTAFDDRTYYNINLIASNSCSTQTK